MMTNIFSTPRKVATRSELFTIAIAALENEGWKVERIARFGKSSVRQITKKGVSKKVSIRTSQDTWIAFPRNDKDNGWATLDDVDYVVAVSVDDRENPKLAKVHMVPAEEMKKRFDRAYAARKVAGYKLPLGRGIWLSLYEKEASLPVTLVGGGIGLDHPAIASVLLTNLEVGEPAAQRDEGLEPDDDDGAEEPLMTILEAKQRLAKSFGVDPDDITITIRH